jgi:hypothetical protein
MNYEGRFTDLNKQMERIYSDLKRLEPIKKLNEYNNSLDIMFIMDCTYSMDPWIEACKNEIKSIIDKIQS